MQLSRASQFLLCLFLVFGCTSETKRTYQVVAVKAYEALPLPEGMAMMDVFRVADGSLYLVSDYSAEKVTQVYLLRETSQGWIRETIPAIGFEHVRHAVDVRTPWGPGILIADHGFDQDPKNVGGITKLIVKTSDGSWVDKTAVLPKRRNFTFHVTPIRRRGLPYDDLLFSAFTDSAHGQNILLRPTNSTYDDVSHLLPLELRNKAFCLMTSARVDLDSDGSDEVFLGGCDGPSKHKDLEANKVMEYRNDAWQWSQAKLGKRLVDSSWATVGVEFDPQLFPGKAGFLTAVHDYGFKRGKFQLYTGSGDDFRETQALTASASEAVDSFIPWVSHLHHDGHVYIAGIKKKTGNLAATEYEKHRWHLLFAHDGKHAEDISRYVTFEKGKMPMSVHAIPNTTLLRFFFYDRTTATVDVRSIASPPVP